MRPVFALRVPSLADSRFDETITTGGGGGGGVSRDATHTTVDSTIFEFNMSALTTLLRRQAEQNPMASYFNVDILKYQIKCKEGAGSCPFQLVAYWKCETTHTDLKVSPTDNVV